MKKKKRNVVVEWIIDILVIIAAAAIFALGAVSFISPNNIAPGGATGVAIILTELTGLPLGLLIAAINVPLIIVGFIILSKKTMVKTLISVAVITVMTDFVFVDFPVYNAGEGNGILAALFGGLLLGAGVGLTYSREATSGGTDIIAKILAKYNPHITLGVLQLVADAVVVLLGLAVFRDLNAAMYAVVSMFVQSKVVDMLVYGKDECRFLLVFSANPDPIIEKLLQQDRGVTILNGEGAYSKAPRKVIATAVYKSSYRAVKRIIKETDPAAFVVTTSASEVLGEGFQKLA